MKRYGFKSTSFSLLMLATLFLTLIPGQAARAAGTRYAKPAASGTGNCSSWENACTLQTALTGAVSGNEVWVVMGTHKPTTTTDRNATFQLKSGVALYGGFAGAETARGQRNWTANITNLSGNIGIMQDYSDNSYHVVTGATGATLDGFTITAGNANGTFPNSYGGGMYNNSGSPVLTNVIFSGNSASDFGGGIYNDYGNPTLTNATFRGNSAEQGGGIFNFHGSLTLTNVTFSGNSAYFGGGFDNQSSSNSTLTDVIFSGNSAEYGGGGLGNHAGSSTLSNVTFSGNSAEYGGGMNTWKSTPVLTNVTFSGNSATASGGGIFIGNGTPTLTNVTISGNTATTSGGGIYSGYTVTLRNTIVANSPAGGNCSGTITDGGNNLSNDSTCDGATQKTSAEINLGVLVDNGGFTQTIPLLPGSWAIDTGNDTTCATADQRGITRPQGAHCDIGAYEYNSTVTMLPPVVTASDGTDNDKVNVSWTASSGATSYVAYRSDSLTGAKFPPSGFAVPGLAGADVWATPGVVYYYWVKACDAVSCSDFSAPETGSRGVVAGLTPPVVTASDGTFLDKVQVTWPAVSGATSYVAFRSDSPSGAKIPTNGFATTNPDGADLWATPGVIYYYWVKACDATSCSDFSAAETGWRATDDVQSYVNYYRSLAGVPPVSFDAILNNNCWEHARYMAENDDLTHNQNPALPYASAAGQICAQKGNAWIGGGTTWQPRDAIDGWMSSVGHRLWLLYPTTPVFGYGFYTAANRAAAGLDVLSLANFNADSGYTNWPVRYPAPNQTSVPPTAYVITLTWRYFGSSPTVTSTSLTTSDGTALAHTVITSLPANHKGIAITPSASLPPNATITVSVSGNYDSALFEYTWSFTTGN